MAARLCHESSSAVLYTNYQLLLAARLCAKWNLLAEKRFTDIHIDCTHVPSNPQTKRAWHSVQYRATPETVSTGSLLLLRMMSTLEIHLRSRGRGSTTVDRTPLKLTNSNDSSPLPPATSRTPVPCLPIRNKSTRKLPHADMAKVANTHCCILPCLDQRRQHLPTFGRHHSE